MQDIKQLATETHVVVLTDVPDICRAMKRWKIAVASEVADIDSFLYDVNAGCSAHKVNGMVSKTFGELSF